MGQVVATARSIYGRTLYTVLFPLVFLITLYTEGSEDWRNGITNAFGFVLLMTLGLMTVYVIHGRI
jgi:polyferredoxin